MKKTMKSFKFLALTMGVCGAALCAPMHDARAEAFNPEQVKELESLFKKFLSENPELILKSVDDFRVSEEKKTQQSAQENLANYAEYFADNGLPIAGNPDGDVTLIEYFDYNCGYCRKAYADVMTLLKEDKNLRVVFQEMPILSPSSKIMAEYAMAAHEQGKYFEMHQALMDYRGGQGDEAYIKLATDLGLDIEKLKADAKSASISASIDKSSSMAKDLGIRGTPGFVIGNEIYPGYIGIDSLRKAVEKARSVQGKK
ncbi:MAG: DsbA family protein [Alphaproteobacteria bacterium]